MPLARKRYAVVGTGTRAGMYLDALAYDYRESAELVAMCDLSRVRLNYHNARLARLIGVATVPTFLASEFDEMLRITRPDVVIVTTIDAVHDHYVVRAMELGCDVICEKPMTTEVSKVEAIFDAVDRTGRQPQVTFNLRYVPHVTKVCELIRDGAIGRPTAVDFSYHLNNEHGGDYFRRWHREKRHSGGLLIHKSTHHFDLVNWWVGSYPKTVFAMGSLNFFGRENAIARGDERLTQYDRYTGVTAADNDPFALRLDSDAELQGLYRDAEEETGYIRDRNVFGDGITSEDTMAVMARYKNGVVLNYSLVCYSPFEGWRANITGTRGSIEIRGVYRSAFVNGSANPPPPAHHVTLMPLFGKAKELDVPTIAGGHGGSDPLMIRALLCPEADPLHRRASYIDGAASVLLGLAANRSIETGLPVDCDDLIALSTAV